MTAERKYEIAKLDLKSGDMLVVKCAGMLTAERADHVRRVWSELAPSVRIIVIDQSIDLSVLTAAEIEKLKTEVGQ